MVTVRRLVPRMAIDLAIDALAEILDHTDGQLLVAGSGPELKTLESHAQDRGLGNRVRFLGRVEDEQLPLLYAAADVCVVPSRELEGFGYVALEALAAGTPVVATGTGGLTELVGGLEPRWVTEATSEAIAGAIVALRESPASFPDAEACQGYARTMDWEAVAPQVERVFREAISGRSRRRDVTDSE
jgi:glycosyltransferase involved in cell wall biosynthesis